jgi:hypothetical protein
MWLVFPLELASTEVLILRGLFWIIVHGVHGTI